MLTKSTPGLEERIKSLWQEAHEFHLIFQKITYTIDQDKQLEKETI